MHDDDTHRGAAGPDAPSTWWPRERRDPDWLAIAALVLLTAGGIAVLAILSGLRRDLRLIAARPRDAGPNLAGARVGKLVLTLGAG